MSAGPPGPGAVAAPSRITEAAFRRVLAEGLPSAAAMAFDVLRLERGRALLRFRAGPAELRPGGTVAGPVLFALADLAMYAAVMSAVDEGTMAVTTDATLHFLRRPRAGSLIARASLLKEGRRLLVGQIAIELEGEEDAPVAHAVMSYSLPPASHPGGGPSRRA